MGFAPKAMEQNRSPKPLDDAQNRGRKTLVRSTLAKVQIPERDNQEDRRPCGILKGIRCACVKAFASNVCTVGYGDR